MKGRFTKIMAALALLVGLTIPMGMWGQTSVTLTQSNLGLTGSYTTNTEKTIDGITYVYTDLMKNNDNIQAKASSGTIKNSTAYSGDITSVAITHSGTARATTINGSANGTDWTQVATGSGSITADFSGKGYKYFQITRGSNAAYWTQIVITYSDGGSSTVATPTFSPAAGTYTQAQNVSISCETDGATIYYTTDGTAPDNNSTEYTGAITVSETMTIKAIAYVGTDASTVASATYTILTLMTIAEARAQGTGVVYTSGTVTSCVGTTGYIQDASAAICVYGASLTVGDNITVQGSLTTYNGLLEIANPVVNVISSGNTIEPEVMTIADINASTNQGWYVRIENATVTDINGQNTTIAQGENTIVVRGISGIEYQVNDIISLNGNIGCYNTVQIVNPQNVEVQESTEPSINIADATIEVVADGGEGILTVQYENITEIEAEVYFCDAEGTEATYDWITVEMDADYNVEWLVEPNEGEARTAYFKVYAIDDEGNDVYSDLVTVNQAAYVAPITNGTGTITFGSAEGSTKINSTSVTGVDDLGNTWTITTVFSGEVSFTQNASYSQVGASSKPATSITFTMTLPNEAVISSFEAKFGGFNGTAGNVTLSVGSEIVGTGALNASNDVTISSLPMITGTILTVTVTDIAKGVKCYYISYTLGAETYPLNISAYGESEGGYYLIASPVTVDPATVENMIYTGEDASNYDLYSFDQTQNEEWRNYKAATFNLVPGKGYLYANKTNGSFTLTGAPYTGDGTVELTYDETADFAGWNLIGNPFATAATLNQPFYRLTNGSEVSAESETGSVNAMEGVFVVATEAGQTVTFSTENNAKAVQQVVMNVTRNRGTVIDRAIVRFDEGGQLPKFQLFESSTKLYIPQGNSDYAIVRSAAEGEMPLNFKAKENGTYTISVNTENVEMDYLHLIDNMTGNDVDLLATPSYTFEATTRDYASRFRLVFSANETDGPSTGSGAFAYFNGSEWQISNIGEATLQVVDVMGRVVKNVALEGNATVSINEMPGVYMMRLLNGNDVKVQKVVIR